MTLQAVITGRWRFAVYALIACLYCIISYYIPRENFEQLFYCYSLLFLFFLLLIRYAQTTGQVREGITLGIIFRLLLLFSLPNLSDDFYRFVWDGHLLNTGTNPFSYTPADYLQTHPSSAFLDSIYPHLNSKHYYSIYPTICQGLYSIAACIGQNNLYISVIILKIFLFASEIGTIYFARKIIHFLHLPEKNILLYALNPLIIVEFTGNLHFEGLMLFFLTASFYFLLRNKDWLSIFFFICATGTKLWPLMLLPFLLKYIGFRRTVRYCFFAMAGSTVLLLPMIFDMRHVEDSVGLYFKTFEYNASIYYFLKWLINPDLHYPAFLHMQRILPILSTGIILLIAFFYKKQQFFSAILFCFLIYFIFSTTIHPWYISPLILLCLFTNYRFPVIWSFLIYLTYITYESPAYQQNYFFITFEYALVFSLMMYEIVRNRKLSVQKLDVEN